MDDSVYFHWAWEESWFIEVVFVHYVSLSPTENSIPSCGSGFFVSESPLISPFFAVSCACLIFFSVCFSAASLIALFRTCELRICGTPTSASLSRFCMTNLCPLGISGVGMG